MVGGGVLFLTTSADTGSNSLVLDSLSRVTCYFTPNLKRDPIRENCQSVMFAWVHGF